ncbi:MAG: fluoride efflux transporter CrcB [Hydrogenophilus sp.]|nr:fluoride efflux transporter CrcB [Hydrogenophilus sp.]
MSAGFATAAAAVFVGAGLGALGRWGLGVAINTLFPLVPPGTVAANWLGGYLVGLFLGWFAANPHLPTELRLFLITGVCGGLTTFSTFSAELVHLLQQSRYGWFVAAAAIHLVGSLATTIAGLATVEWLLRR